MPDVLDRSSVHVFDLRILHKAVCVTLAGGNDLANAPVLSDSLLPSWCSVEVLPLLGDGVAMPSSQAWLLRMLV